MRDTEREAETQTEGEQAPSKEPDVGFDPETPGSHPGPKAGTKPLSHPGIPTCPPSFRIQPNTPGKAMCIRLTGTGRNVVCSCEDSNQAPLPPSNS